MLSLTLLDSTCPRGPPRGFCNSFYSRACVLISAFFVFASAIGRWFRFFAFAEIGGGGIL